MVSQVIIPPDHDEHNDRAGLRILARLIAHRILANQSGETIGKTDSQPGDAEQQEVDNENLP